MWIYLIALFAILLYVFKLWLNVTYSYWKKRNIPHPEVNLLFGNLKNAVLLRKTLGEVISDFYREYYDLPYFGFYKSRSPALIVKDPEVLKIVLVKEFNSFHDNDIKIDEKVDPMFARNPFVLTGSRWKHVRNQITPCFTSGKIKAIFPIMQKMARKFLQHLENLARDDEGIESKSLCAKFTIENVVCCSFGIDANVFEDPNSIFTVMAKKVTTPSIWMGIKTIITFYIPELSNIFSISFFSPSVTDYFRKLTGDIRKYRKENNIKRYDFLDNLLEVQEKDPTIEDEDLTAHCVGLFFDGFETSSAVMSFVLYNLAKNPEAQAKLRQEIDDVLVKGNDNYETIVNLPYLDACINESLRLHPPVGALFKKCTQNITISPPEGKNNAPPLEVEKDTSIIVPTLALHMDEKYYPEPKMYKPERFTDGEITKYTFMPFGEGPRACLGQRFGLTQIKVAIFYLISEYEIKVNKKMTDSIILDPTSFLTAAKGGLWLNYYKRNQ